MIHLIIDVNVIPLVISEYKDKKAKCLIMNYIMKRKAKWVYGGKTYKNELRVFKREEYLNFFAQLSRASLYADLSKDKEIDSMEKEIYKLKKKAGNFNDGHLIAVAIIGSVRIIYTHDEKSHKYLTNKSLYPKKCEIPKVYNSNVKNKYLNQWMSQ